MRCLQQYERSTLLSTPITSVLAVTLPTLYPRDYYFRVVRAVGSATATIYVFTSKSHAKNKLLTLPGPAVGSGTFTHPQAAASLVSITPYVGADPDVTGMALLVSSQACGTSAYSEVWGYTAEFGYNTAEEVLSWLTAAGATYPSAEGMPLYGCSFEVLPENAQPGKWPAVALSYRSGAPQYLTSGRFMLSATLIFRVFNRGVRPTSQQVCAERLAYLCSLVFDDYRFTWPSPWGRLWHHIEFAGQFEPATIDDSDPTAFEGRLLVEVQIEAHRDNR
jgi:hypothetical protein